MKTTEQWEEATTPRESFRCRPGASPPRPPPGPGCVCRPPPRAPHGHEPVTCPPPSNERTLGSQDGLGSESGWPPRATQLGAPDCQGSARPPTMVSGDPKTFLPTPCSAGRPPSLKAGEWWPVYRDGSQRGRQSHTSTPYRFTPGPFHTCPEPSPAPDVRRSLTLPFTHQTLPGSRSVPAPRGALGRRACPGAPG